MQLKDKVAIVTGGAQGIGAAVAREFVAEGAQVVLGDIQDEKGVELARELGGHEVCRYVRCDVSQADQVDAMFSAAVSTWGRIDSVVSNAGIGHNATILEISEEDFDRVIAVNLKGAFLVGRAAGRWMANHGGGTIINMSSINAVVCSPHIVPYAVSKGGINQLTSVMALGLAPHNVRVNGVGPGSIDTDMMMKTTYTNPDALKGILARTPMGRLGDAREIARACVFLASDDSSYMTGQTVYVDGGRLRLAYTVPLKD